MAVEQLSSRTVTAISASAATDTLSQLREGAILEGRVLAINPDDTLKLATRLGQLDIAPSLVALAGAHGGRGRQTLSQDLIGTTVRFEVAAQTASSGRLIVRLLTGDETPLASAATAQDVPETPSADINARIASEIAHAAAQQDGLAPVFSTAAALQSAGADLPDTLTKALANLAGFALSAEDLSTPQAVRTAFLGSGLFLESRLASLAAGGASINPETPLTGQDLKAALLTLKPLLDDWLATRQGAGDAANGTLSTAGRAAPQQSPVAPAGSALNEASFAGVANAPVDTEALFAVLRPPPVASVQGADAMKALAALSSPAQPTMPGAASLSSLPDSGTLAQLGALMEATGLGVPASGRRGPYGGRPLAAHYAARPAEETPVATGRPPPPRRGSPPLGQAAIPLPEVETTPNRAAELARALSSQVSNAIARISLGQYASLPEQANAVHTAGAHTRDETSSWLFEIPIAVARGVSIAQFEIDQVHERMAGAEAAGPAWRVQFSIDVNDLGPVHARLVLGGQQIAVGLWAETPAGIATVSALVPLLRRRLEDAGLAVAEIHFATGRPPSGPPARAGGFVDRNA